MESTLFEVNAVWGQRCLGSALFGVNAVWGQRCLGSALFGVNAVWGQRCLGWPGLGLLQRLPELFVGQEGSRQRRPTRRGDSRQCGEMEFCWEFGPGYQRSSCVNSKSDLFLAESWEESLSSGQGVALLRPSRGGAASSSSASSSSGGGAASSSSSGGGAASSSTPSPAKAKEKDLFAQETPLKLKPVKRG